MKRLPSQGGRVLVIGSAGMDLVGRPHAELHPGTSTPGRLRMSFGGVARNVAENLARLGTETSLITAVGDDRQGSQLLAHAQDSGIDVAPVLQVAGARTSAYLAVLDESGRKHLALDDMGVLDSITPEYLRSQHALFDEASVVFLDANLAPKSLAAAVSLCRRADVPLVGDPTSSLLAPRLLPHLADIWMITPNEREAGELCSVSVPHGDRERGLAAARSLLSRGVECAILAMAECGVCYASTESSGHVPALVTEVLDPTGAGDAMTAAVLFGLLNDIPIDEAVRLGAAAAAITLRTSGSVVPNLSLELLYDQLR
jgi:pseudouridine kinase